MNDSTEMIADALRLNIAHAEKEAASNLFNYASAQLGLKKIEERRATLFTTAFEHVEKGALAAHFGELSPRERDLMRCIARYVSCGRTD